MRLLVVHQNFPGQFGHMVKAWASRPGWDVRGLGRETAPGLPGFDKLMRYSLARKGHSCVGTRPILLKNSVLRMRPTLAARWSDRSFLHTAGYQPITIFRLWVAMGLAARLTTRPSRQLSNRGEFFDRAESSFSTE